jgi:hypothetical protein
MIAGVKSKGVKSKGEGLDVFIILPLSSSITMFLKVTFDPLICKATSKIIIS